MRFVTVVFLGISIGYIDSAECTLVALMLYVGSFSVGLSTEAFVIPSEVFPLEFRA